MNQRYNKMNEIIKQWTKTGKQDKNILKALHAQVNLENAPQVKPDSKLNESTMYADLNNERLYAMYEKQPFNNLSTKEIQHLIQETHNRFINKTNCDVTRHVVVDSDKEQEVFGYVCAEDNLLFINKYMIDKAKNNSTLRDSYNVESVGKCVLFTTLHESQHVAQFDNSIKFALREEQSRDEVFSGVITSITNSNFFAAEEKNDEMYFTQWQAMYDYHFLEHEANYTATKTAESLIDESNKNGMGYHQYIVDNAINSLRYIPSVTESNHGKIKTRVQKIENYINKQIAYFEKNIEDCPLKSEMLKIAKSYTRIDEKGNSELRTRLFNEINEIDKACVESIKAVKDMRKTKNKKFSSFENAEFSMHNN